ncbi:hypothetical protein PQO01_18170 [Lentisphaera marina]|uniref:hypothetical protein n=1 Tax=Lentisphaera marina TaxID=1111041 RepID=UPI00236553A6|nr:hypothetical protein [Lentisphaera marina]MDD7986878.1 hypothetical protein [Lentisphaera marina]
MKYLIIFFLSLGTLAQSNTKLKYSEQHISELKALKYYNKKYAEPAKKEIADLQKDIDRYKTGLAKLNKNSKTYKTRYKELQSFEQQQKAYKILVLYPSLHIKAIEAYTQENFASYQKNLKLKLAAERKYKELANKPFPRFIEDFSRYEKGKKKRTERPTKKRTASTQ